MISRLEDRDRKLVGITVVNMSRQRAEELERVSYAELGDKPFDDDLVEFIVSGLVVSMVWGAGRDETG